MQKEEIKMLKKIVKFVPGVVIPMLINFLLTMLYAGFLKPEEYGMLNIYLNTIQIVYSVSASIFQTASLRYYSMRRTYTDEKDFISSYIFGNFFATIIVMIASLLINLFFEFNWWVIVLSIGCNSLYQFLCNWYRLENQSDKYNILRCVASVLTVFILVIFFLVVKPLTYIWPIIALYGSYGILASVELIILREKVSIRRVSVKLLKASIVYGLPLIGVSVLGYVVSSFDQFFLLYFLGDEAVGNYALGHRLVDALIVNVLMMVLLVMTPELNKQHDCEGEQKSGIILKNMISIAVWIILPVSAALIVYAPYIINFVFPAYNSAAHIMQLVVFASIFHGVSMFTCKGLELIKKPQYIFYGLLIAAIVNCTYNAVFIPIYGIDASAHSSLIAYVVYNVALVLFTKKYYPLKCDVPYLLKTLVVTVITVVVAVVLQDILHIHDLFHLVLEGFVCAITYVTLSFALKLLKVFK